jgi:predicted nucleic acid-binding protein
MSLVVDASVAVKWFVEEEDTKRACLLADGAEEIHCPHLLASEVGSALWRKVLQGQVELGDARTGMQSLARMPITWHADEALGADCLRLAFAHDRTVYDSMYLALAYRLNARLVTADLRFANALAATDASSMVLRLRDCPDGFAGPPGG